VDSYDPEETSDVIALAAIGESENGLANVFGEVPPGFDEPS
jgi:hypothetical protein